MNRTKLSARRWRLLVVAAAGCALTAGTALAPAATVQAATQRPVTQRPVTHRSAALAPPVYTTTTGQFDAVTVISAADAWAVGQLAYGSESILIAHWNGSAWATFPGPALHRSAVLAGLAASSAKNVWAVGAISSRHGSRTLILHFNGVRWSRVPSPSPAVSAGLYSVTVTRSGSAWAVGSSFPRSGGEDALILGWTGRKWREDSLGSSSNPELKATSLNSVAAGSADSAWAVGQGLPGYFTTFARWRGRHWRVVAGPDVESGYLQSLALAPHDQAWAVGRVGGRALIMRYTGSSWRRVRIPESAREAWLNSVAVAPDGTAWAVGQAPSERGVILHWTGHGWHSVPVPDISIAGSTGAILVGVAAYSSGDAWAVGVTYGGDGFILQWNGAQW
jgi:hypothetical protein